MAQLSHPNVVSVFDVGTYGDEIVIVLELVEGQTLARWLGERPRPWQEIRSAFIDAGKGLAAAHAVQLVHRDFKPANVLVGTDGRVRVTDFGLARTMELDDEAKSELADAEAPTSSSRSGRPPLVSMTATEDGGLAGTPVYMAPEQFRRRRADARTDQFSFCVALYMALYRRHPYLVGASKLYTLEQLADSVTNGTLQLPNRTEVPSAFLEILRRGLQVDPKARFASMQELLDKLMSDWTVAPAAPARKASRLMVLIATAAVALAGVAALILSSHRTPNVDVAPGIAATTGLAPELVSTAHSAAPASSMASAESPAPVATPSAASPLAAPGRRPRPAHTQETKARRPPPPPGRERYVDGLKDPF